MNELFEFFGTIGLKADELYKGLDKVVKDAEKTAKEVGSKFKGVGKTINEGMQSVATGLQSALTTVSTVSTKIGTTLTDKITKPALAAGAALGAIVIGKGWQRLVSIDDARAKLNGLGHDAASVNKIMDDALAAVRGTAHGMGEAVTTAATAVAAGVKPGKDLQRYLTIIGDVAAIAGSKMDEMGSIINKVTTSGMVQAEELNQLGDRGIPIIQWLAEELGVTAQEVRKLASDGKVSSETFLNAIEKNIGGAAKTMGATSFTAMIDNIGASLGRMGANLLNSNGKVKGLFDQIKDLLPGVLGSMDALEQKAKVWGDLLAYKFAQLVTKFKEYRDWWSNISGHQRQEIGKMVKSIGIFAVVLGPILKVLGSIASVGAVATKGMNSLSKYFSKAAATAAGATGKLAGFQGAFMSSMGVLSTMGAIGVGAGAFGGILALLGLVQEQFGDELDAFFTMAKEQGDGIIRGLVAGVTERLPELISQGTTLVVNFLGAVAANLPAIISGGAQILGGLITGLSDNLPRLIGVALEVGAQFIIGLIQALPDIIAAGASLIGGLVNGIIENLPLLWEKLLEIKNEIIKVVSESVQPAIEKYQEWADMHPVLSAAIEGLLVSLSVLVGGFLVFNGAAAIFTTALGWITTGFAGIATAIGLIATPAGWIILLLGVLMAAVYAVWTNWDEVTDWMTEKVTALHDAIKKAMEDWKELFDSLKEWQNQNLQDAEQEIINKYGPEMAGQIEGADVEKSGFWSNLFGGKKEKIQPPEIDTSAVEAILLEVHTMVATKIAEIEALGRDLTTKLMNGMQSGIITNKSKVILNLQIMLKDIETKLSEHGLKLTTTVSDIMAKLEAAFRAGIPGVTEAGRETGRGFYNGLASQETRILNLARSIAKQVDSVVRQELDINSPSDVADATFSEYINGGLRAMLRGVGTLRDAGVQAANAVVQQPDANSLSLQRNQGGNPMTELVDELREIKRTNLMVLQEMERGNEKSNDTILDGKRVSKGMHEYSEEHRKRLEALQSRQKGVWA